MNVAVKISLQLSASQIDLFGSLPPERPGKPVILLLLFVTFHSMSGIYFLYQVDLGICYTDS